MHFDGHDYESAIKDLKEASAIDDRNLKVCFVYLTIKSDIYFFYRFK